MKIKPEDWLKLCNKRMERTNIHDEIECSKMLRDLVNRYFAIGKKDISGAAKGYIKGYVKGYVNNDKKDLKDKDNNADKYIQGWNISYYIQPVKWEPPKK
ncbi:hypothetical protein [Desulfolucanica intricata]|uniref:hypothetical protein n=1 Tax=Desulfolucanica intricata TaxID=1285191 RepID=UPI000830FCAF|nr:hypothetical protein [Desulfolucanica intricata]